MAQASNIITDVSDHEGEERLEDYRAGDGDHKGKERLENMTKLQSYSLYSLDVILSTDQTQFFISLLLPGVCATCIFSINILI